jgi:hypothetical protein
VIGMLTVGIVGSVVLVVLAGAFQEYLDEVDRQHGVRPRGPGDASSWMRR